MPLSRRQFLQLCGVASVSAPSWTNSDCASQNVIVIGAGIVGTSIAYHLAKRGARITLCEKSRPGSGATGNSFAWLNASFEKQPHAYYLMNLLGIAGWARLQHELKDELRVQWGGSIAWFPEGKEAEKLREDVRRHEGWGYATHLLSVKEFRQLLPDVVTGPISVATYNEFEGTVNPSHALEVLLNGAKRLGVRMLCPCEAIGFELNSGRICSVQTTRGRLVADVVVLAAGVGATDLANKVNVPLPLKPSAGVLVHTSVVPHFLGQVVRPPGVHIKQNPGGEVVMGTSFEVSPVADANADVDSGRRILQTARSFIPALSHTSIARVTVGRRVLPRDGYPVLGFASDCPNLYIASTHSGMTLSPLIGQLACLEILDKAYVDLLTPYRPSRFSG